MQKTKTQKKYTGFALILFMALYMGLVPVAFAQENEPPSIPEVDFGDTDSNESDTPPTLELEDTDSEEDNSPPPETEQQTPPQNTAPPAAQSQVQSAAQNLPTTGPGTIAYGIILGGGLLIQKIRKK